MKQNVLFVLVGLVSLLVTGVLASDAYMEETCDEDCSESCSERGYDTGCCGVTGNCYNRCYCHQAGEENINCSNCQS